MLARARELAYWAAAPLLALLLYWPGLISWFQKDDFAWLGLYGMLHGWRDLGRVLFQPFAQGTVRTLSERVFFTLFRALFDMNPLPYRCWVFLTFIAALTMLTAVAWKLTGSRAVGLWAAILWTVNGEMAFVLSWTAIYYELLCALWFLSALWLLIRYAETGERRFFLAEWVVFLLGFGVLELNVVYPALAAAFALCRAPRILRHVLPMFGASGVYAVAHTLASPLPASGPYRLHWDGRVFSALWRYWKMALGPSRLIMLGIYPSPWRSALTILLTVGLLSFLIWKLKRGERMAAFYPAWFVIVLAPLLPLRDHIDDSYLTIPLAGLAIWGAWALVSGWRSRMPARVAAVALLAIYVCVSIPLARVNVLSFYQRSQQIRAMVEGVVKTSRGHRGNTILLANVEPDLFWSGIYFRPFRLYRISDVYVLAAERNAIAGLDPQDISAFFLDPAQAPGAIIYDVKRGDAIQ
jgi:hypothetical protein